MLCVTCYQTFAMTTYSERAINLFEIIVGKYSEIGSKWTPTFTKHDMFWMDFKRLCKNYEDIVVKMEELIMKKDMEYKETMRKTFPKKNSPPYET